MFSNNPDEHPEETSLPVQNQNEFKCCNCDQKSAQIHCCPIGHTMSICAKCKDTGITCLIYNAPLEKFRAAEGPGQNRASSAGDGSKVGEENENSDGLKVVVGDKNPKKRKHDDSEAEDSQDDIIESDEKEIVFKVKAGQTVKLINDDDNSTFSVAKKPGVEYSITSTSTSAENKTSHISFSFAPNEISKILSTVLSTMGAIQVGAPVVGNSSTATTQTPPANMGNCGNMGNSSLPGIYQTQTAPPPLGNMGMQMGSMGMQMGVPSVYGPGANVTRSNSTAIITTTPPSLIFGNGGMGNSSPAVVVPSTVPSIFGPGGNGGGGSGVYTYNGSNVGVHGGGSVLFGSGGGGIFGGAGDGWPSVYGPGTTVTRNNSTFTANGIIINGHNNNIIGNGNVINGSNNRISGNTNKVNGANNQIMGNSNEIVGSNNILRGFGNRTTGFNNQ